MTRPQEAPGRDARRVAGWHAGVATAAGATPQGRPGRDEQPGSTPSD